MSLPLQDIEEIDLNGFLFVNFPIGESMKRSLMKTEMRILSDVEDEIADIIKYKRWGENFPYDDPKEIDEYRKSRCVISPMTLWMSLSYDRRKEIEKWTPQRLEAEVMKLHPGRFKARFKENKPLEYAGKNDVLRKTVMELLETPVGDDF